MTSAGVSYGSIRAPSLVPVAKARASFQMRPGSNLQPLATPRSSSILRGEATRFDEPLKFLPVVFIVMNMAVMYWIYFVHHLTPLVWAHKSSTRDLGFLQSVVFQIVTAMVALCYVRCVLVDPGSVPPVSEEPAWSFPNEVQGHVDEELKRLRAQLNELSSSARGTTSEGLAEMERIQYQIRMKQATVKLYGEQQQLEEVLDPSCMNLQEAKKTGSRRSCKWCQKFKPDRCHHCRVCRSCILKMDHHCPWIYNCVGFRNHKYFFLLLFYSMLDLNWVFWTMLPSFLDALDESTEFSRMFSLMFGQMLVGFLGFMVSFFFCFHVYLMLQAMTTIEFCEKSTRRMHYDNSVFDRGVWGNIKAVLGDSVLTWGIPFFSPSGDGLSFSGVDNNEQLHELADSLETLTVRDQTLSDSHLAAWRALPATILPSSSASMGESPFRAARPVTPPDEREKALLISPMSSQQVDGDTGGIGGEEPAQDPSDGSSMPTPGQAPLAGSQSLQQPLLPPRDDSPPIP